MPAYSGSCEYLDERGAVLVQGACQLNFDAETCIVTTGAAQPLAFDPGDVDAVNAGEWDLELKLFTGRAVRLRKFGAAFGRMRDELTAAWRDRTVRCLLLEDLEEIGRYNGAANGAPAEIRLYKSNIAVLPAAGFPRQWRLADAEAVAFDDAAYALALQFGGERLVLGKLAKKTDEFRGRLDGALEVLRTNSADLLHKTFPFLDPDRLAGLLALMPEGRSAPLSALAAIHPKLPAALFEQAVDARLKPYFDALQTRTGGSGPMAGFKFIAEADEDEAETDEDDTPEPESAEGSEEAEEPEEAEEAADGEEKLPLFFWFFFPLPGSLLAWEASTGKGRATYVFRTAPGESPELAAARLTRGLALVNFRREPVYLPDDSLERRPRFRRYAIGCRKLPDLRALRAAYVGRAIHSSLATWTAQMKKLTRA